MPSKIPLPEVEPESNRLLNKTFFSFLFNFISIVAGILALILLVAQLGGMLE